MEKTGAILQECRSHDDAGKDERLRYVDERIDGEKQLSTVSGLRDRVLESQPLTEALQSANWSMGKVVPNGAWPQVPSAKTIRRENICFLLLSYGIDADKHETPSRGVSDLGFDFVSVNVGRPEAFYIRAWAVESVVQLEDGLDF